jgi:hypothetical protein
MVATGDAIAWSLAISGGKRFAITAGGLLIGRSASADIVLPDTAASRAQAMVVAGVNAPTLLVMGRGTTAVNDVVVTEFRELAAGDRVSVPGLVLEVIADGVIDATPGQSWVVQSSGGGFFGVARTPFSVGGRATASLRVAGWPDDVMCFHVSETFHIEAIEPVRLDGALLAAGAVELLTPGSIIEYRDERFVIVAGGALGADSTTNNAHDPTASLPDAVRLEFLPRGGRLIIGRRGRDSNVYLAERRCDLIAALLQPGAGLVAGDYIPDDVLIPKIWPGRDMTRVDLNVLLHRTRNDLVRAGLDGSTLLARSPGGGTRFALARGAVVVVE